MAHSIIYNFVNYVFLLGEGWKDYDGFPLLIGSPSVLEARKLLEGVGLSYEGELGVSVYRAVNADGVELAAKICRVPQSGEVDPAYRLETRFGQMENEWVLLSGPLLGCPGVPCASFHRTPEHIILLQQPVGKSLLDIPLPSDQKERDTIILQWGQNVAVILEAIHARGVFHRDIKPGNIIMNDDGSLVVIDFGFSILIKDQFSVVNTRSRVGTNAYGSTNYQAKRPVTPRDDFESLVYSLHALRVGVPEWVDLVSEGKMPNFCRLCEIDPVAATVVPERGILGSPYVKAIATAAGVAVFGFLLSS